MIGDDPTPFFDLGGFAVEVTLCKADSSNVVETKGIPEDAVLGEETTERASHASFQPQITIPTADAEGFGEDDEVKHSGKTFIILDHYSDTVQTTFTLEEK